MEQFLGRELGWSSHFVCFSAHSHFEAGFALDVHTFKKSFVNAFYSADQVL